MRKEMRKPTGGQRARAFVLVVAMFVIAMLTALVAQLALTSGVAAVVAVRQRDVLAARAAAHSVLNLIAAEGSGQLLRPPDAGRPHDPDRDEEPRLTFDLGQAHVQLYVRSEAGKRDLNRINAGGKGAELAKAVHRIIQENDLPLPEPAAPDAPLIVTLQQLFDVSIDPKLLYGPRPGNKYLARYVTIGPPPGGGTAGLHSIYILVGSGRVSHRLFALVRPAGAGAGAIVVSSQEIRQR